MGGIISEITDAVGLTNHKGQRRMAEQAAQASNNANALARENLEFQREQYEDWKNIYGDIQENLGEYFKNLGPERIVTLGLQKQQEEHQRTVKQINQTLAQRGLQDSKFESYLQTSADSMNNLRRADIRATADEKVAQQKMSFLQLGLNQGSEMRGNINNAANLGVGSASKQASMYSNQFGILANNNNSMLRSELISGSLGTLAGHLGLR